MVFEHAWAFACLPSSLSFLSSAVAQAAGEEYPASTSKKPVKVFILAGQSNMEGRGFPEPLAGQVTQEKYRGRYKHFIQGGDYSAFTKKIAETSNAKNGRQQPTYLWSGRHDVWIDYLGQRGNLTVGYGAPRQGFGPEFNFGHVVGNHFDQQVLLVKTSWGGRALARGFLPPSSMLSDEEYGELAGKQNAATKKWNAEEPKRIAQFNQRAMKKNKTAKRKQRLRKFKPRKLVTTAEYREQFGKDYRNMIREVRECLANLGERFPGYKDQGYELAGFVWFQGWNDQYQDRWLTYEKNMANFIRDVRKDLKASQLPFVVGQMGHDGMKKDKPDSPRDYIKKAQEAVPQMNEFKGNTLCVKTDKYWDTDAHAIFTGPGSWRADVDKWRQFGNDFPYHYYGSPWTFAQIGTGFGEGMLTLLENK